MAVASEGGQTSRPRGPGRSSAAKANGSTSSRETSRAQSRSGARTQARTPSASSNGAQAQHGNRDALMTVGISVVSATIGAAGGVLLGRSAMQRNHKVLG